MTNVLQCDTMQWSYIDVEHLLGAQDAIKSGAKVRIRQMDKVAQAEQVEKKIIARDKPKFNIQKK